MKIIPSNLSSQRYVLWTIDEDEDDYKETWYINEGDMHYDSNIDGIVLECNKLDSYRIFEKLISIEDWAGKRIVDVKRLNGSRCSGSPRSPLYNQKGDVYLFVFDDGSLSCFVQDGYNMINTFEKASVPNFDLLVKAGMISSEMKKERDAEYETHENLLEKMDDLLKNRKIIQKSLLDSSEPQKAYRQIEIIEEEYVRCGDILRNRDWVWVDVCFDLHHLSNKIPNLVNVFNWMERDEFDDNDVSKLISIPNCEIVAVHKIFDSMAATRNSKDVFSIEFRDGSYSVSIGLCSGCKLRLPVSTLRDVNVISTQEYSNLMAYYDEYDDELESEISIILRNIDDLHRELSRFGLGEKRTREIIEEIKALNLKLNKD